MVALLLRNVAYIEDWSLTDPHTVLHLLTNPSDDQAYILQILAPQLDLASAIYIWMAWAASFTTPDGP